METVQLLKHLLRTCRQPVRPKMDSSQHQPSTEIALLHHLGKVQKRCSALIKEQTGLIAELRAQTRSLQNEIRQRDAEIRQLRCQLGHDAASEIICRTGCLSHDKPSWRDNDHCRLHGHPCLHADEARIIEHGLP